MKKILLILFIILMTVSPISAKTLQGGVEYTEAQIKQMAFDGVKKKLPRKMIKSNQIDPFFDENKALLEKGINETDDRYIRFLGDGWYSIRYLNNIWFSYMYDSIGKLIFITQIVEFNKPYPQKWFFYNSDGVLKYVTISVEPDDVSVYDPNGNFVDHVRKNGDIIEHLKN